MRVEFEPGASLVHWMKNAARESCLPALTRRRPGACCGGRAAVLAQACMRNADAWLPDAWLQRWLNSDGHAAVTRAGVGHAVMDMQ